ncbi:tungstate/molybdate transport system permease protein [Staphylothermus marinus F1]|uniref:Tungstate/molybdate transport system permease protein n=1 Tax=Staphylothermus marinus (strain ATCC 43588 / DSM 3639 / JCM 9404 / F1) TaxID=399550 RepID=A3DL84_STAMF|nr:ABC transporter permease [Staphylothermus marinus]ABN69394.1 tungstate/molybdate transport system permease protein [Staphylothermus marinus F1]
MQVQSLRKIEGFLLVFVTISSLGILFILSPIIALFISADPETFSQVWLQDNVFSRQAYPALLLTIQASITSTLILLFIGIPTAYLLARYSFKGKQFIEGLIDVPLMIPHTIVGIMILLAYGRNGLFSDLPHILGLSIENSFWGIVAAMLFVSFPIMIDTLKLGYEKISVSLEFVARSLGASRWITFIKITLPLLLPNIIVGFLLSWARALSEVGSILIVAYYPKTINVLIYEWFNTYGLRYTTSLSSVVVLLSLFAFIGIRVLFKK